LARDQKILATPAIEIVTITFFFRIKQLQHFKERAELLSHAKTNPNMLTDKMSKYEATVMNEIQKLEEKLEEDMEIEEMESQKEKQRNNDPGLLKRGYNMFKTVIPSF